MSTKSFDKQSVKSTGSRQKKNKLPSREMTPQLSIKSDNMTESVNNSLLQINTDVKQDQPIFGRGTPKLGQECKAESAAKGDKVIAEEPAEPSEHSTADSGGETFEGQYLVPPENFRRCEGDDIDTLLIENDRLRYIIQTLNQKWALSGPHKKIYALQQELYKTKEELLKSNAHNEKLQAEVARLSEELKKHECTIIDLEKNQKETCMALDQQQTMRFKLEKDVKGLYGDLEAKYSENRTLKRQVTQKAADYDKLYKQLDCYIGHKDDMTDQALCKYLNEYPEKEKLEILFLRESEGVYQFGSQKVHVKIGKNNDVKVRVGGGYLAISEFIDKFTQIEKDKIQRKDVVERFNNKIQMQQICQNLATNMVETTPINVSQNISSPRKSIRSQRSPFKNDSPMKANETTKASDYTFKENQ